MAKKTQKFKTDDFDFNDGMDGLDIPDFGGMPDGDTAVQNSRTVATVKTVGAVGAGFIDQAASISFMRNMVKKTLPSGYGQAMDMVDDTASTIRNTYSEAVKEIKPAIIDIKRITARVLPSVQSVLPRSVSEKIKQWTEPKNKINDLSKEQQEEASLQMQLGEIFQMQAQADATKSSQDNAKETIQNAIEHGRHQDMFGVLDTMRISMQQLANYQNKIGINFQRKSLELQFRSYFLAQQSLVEQREFFVKSILNLEGILKNTGLPEFLKLRNSERLKEALRNKFIDTVSDTVIGKRKDLVKNVLNNVGEAAKNKISETMSAIRSGIDMGEQLHEMSSMMKESGMGGSTSELVGGMVGGAGADYIGDKIARSGRSLFRDEEGKIRSKRSNELLEDYDSEENKKKLSMSKRFGMWLDKTMRDNIPQERIDQIEKYGNKLSYTTENMPQQMLGWRKNRENGTSIEREGFFGKLLSLLDPNGALSGVGDVVSDSIGNAMSTDNVLTGDSAGSMQDSSGAGFTRGASKSVTEIIPGYLARIYQELQIIRTGNDKVELVRYDFKNNRFDTASSITKGVVSLLTGADKNAEDRAIELDKFVKTKRLTPEKLRKLDTVDPKHPTDLTDLLKELKITNAEYYKYKGLKNATKSTSSEEVKRQANELIELIEKDKPKEKRLNSKQKVALRKMLIKSSMDGEIGSFERLSDPDTYNTRETRPYADIYAEWFKEYADDENNTDEESASKDRDFKQKIIARKYNEIGDRVQILNSPLQDLLNTGHRDILEELGILKPGSDRLEVDKIREYQTGGVSFGKKTTYKKPLEAVVEDTEPQYDLDFTQNPQNSFNFGTTNEINTKDKLAFSSKRSKSLFTEPTDVTQNTSTVIGTGGINGSILGTLKEINNTIKITVGDVLLRIEQLLSKDRSVDSESTGLDWDIPEGHADGGVIYEPNSKLRGGDSVDKKLKPGSYVLPTDTTKKLGLSSGGLVDTKLMHGERVLDPATVNKIGVDKLDAIKDATHTQHLADGGSVERSNLIKAIKETAKDLLVVIKESNSKKEIIAVNTTLERIEKHLKDGLVVNVNGVGTGSTGNTSTGNKKRWYNESLKNAAGSLFGAGVNAVGAVGKFAGKAIGGAFSNTGKLLFGTKKTVINKNEPLTPTTEKALLDMDPAEFNEKYSNTPASELNQMFDPKYVPKTEQGFRGLFGIGKDLIKSTFGKFTEVKDIYIKGEFIPRLTAWKLKAGMYKDQLTGTIIKSYKDIAGAVVDSEGNIVLTAEEAKKAFIKTNIGEKLISGLGSIVKGIKNTAGAIIGRLPAVYRFGIEVVKKLYNLTKMPQDVYVKGKKDPVLLARVMRVPDGYISSVTGNMIKHPGDIDGPVYGPIINGKRETVLTMEDLQAGLVDYNGNPIRSGLGRVVGFFTDKIKTVGKYAKKGFDYVKTKVSGGLSYLGNKIKNAAQGGGSSFGNISIGNPFGGNNLVIKRLTQIRDLINLGLPESSRQTFNDAEDLKSVINLGDKAKEAVASAKSAIKNVMQSRTVTKAKTQAKDLIKKVNKNKFVKQAVGEFNKLKVDPNEPLTRTTVEAMMAISSEEFNEKYGNSQLTNAELNAQFDPSKTLKGRALTSIKNTFNKVSESVKKRTTGITGKLKKALGLKPRDPSDTATVIAAGQKSILDVLKERLPAIKKRIIGDADGDGDRDGSYLDQIRNKFKSKDKSADGTTPTDGSGIAGKGLLGTIASLFSKKKKDDSAATASPSGVIGGVSDLATGAAAGGIASKALGYGKKALGWVAKGALGLKALVGLGGAATAGTAAAGAGGAAAAGGGLLAGTAALLASPVVLGVLAVAATAAVGYGLYKGYKFLTKKKITPLSKIRYAQYGFLEKDTEHLQGVFGLEDILKEAVSYKGGVATLDGTKIKVKDIVGAFGVDLENKDQFTKLMQWITNRFKPVYLTHLTALHSVAPGKSLDRVESLKPTEQKQYLNIAKFTEGPYSYSGSPFPKDGSLAAGPNDVKKAVAEVEETLKDVKDIAVPGAAALVGANAAARSNDLTETKTGKVMKAEKEPESLWSKTKSALTSKTAAYTAAGVLGVLGLSSAVFGIGATASAVGGTLALGAGATVGTLGLAAGLITGIAGLLATPVVIGTLVAGATAYGLYKGYKQLTKTKLNVLSKIRYAQYGFLATDEAHLEVVFGLEKIVKDAVAYSEGQAQFREDKLAKVLKEALKSFNIDINDKPALSKFTTWFGLRFKPVYLLHLSALNTVGKDKTLSDVGTMLPIEKQKYLDLIKFSDGPYNEKTSPFPNDKELVATGTEVRTYIDIASKEIKDQLSGKRPNQTKLGTTILAGATEGFKKAGVLGALAGGSMALTNVVANSLIGDAKAKALDPKKIAGDALKLATGESSSDINISVNGIPGNLNAFNKGKLDALTTIRYKTYGLVEMELSKVKALDALETLISKRVVYKGDIAHWESSIENVINTIGSTFGVNNYTSKEAIKFTSWFNLRFLPVYLNFLTTLTKLTGSKVKTTTLTTLKPESLLDLAISIYTTSTKNEGNTISVWRLPDSPWDGYVLNDEVKSTEGNVQSIRDGIKESVLAEENAKDKAGPVKNPFLDKVKDTASNVFDKATTGLSNFASNIGLGAVSKGIDSVSYDIGQALFGGKEVTHAGNGTGGDINSIPLPKGDGSWDAVKDTIVAASRMVGVDEKVMATMAAVESGFRTRVKAETSSATGLYQFIKDTWKSMILKYGKKYGIHPRTEPTDPRANALMGAEYIKENIQAIKGTLKRPLTDTDVYLAHFLGAGGAKTFFRADTNEIAARVMPKAAAANSSIFYHANRTPRTIGETYSEINRRFRSKAKKFETAEMGMSSSVPTNTKGATAPIAGATPKVDKTQPTIAKAPEATTTRKGRGSTTVDTNKPVLTTVPTIAKAANDPMGSKVPILAAVPTVAKVDSKPTVAKVDSKPTLAKVVNEPMTTKVPTAPLGGTKSKVDIIQPTLAEVPPIATPKAPSDVPTKVVLSDEDATAKVIAEKAFDNLAAGMHADKVAKYVAKHGKQPSWANRDTSSGVSLTTAKLDNTSVKLNTTPVKLKDGGLVEDRKLFEISDQTPGLVAARSTTKPKIKVVKSSEKTENDVSGIANGGFMSPRARDAIAQKDYQKSATAETLKKVSKTLDSSLSVNEDQLEVLNKILATITKGIVNKAKADSQSTSKITNSNPQPTGTNHSMNRGASRAPEAPVSMSKRTA